MNAAVIRWVVLPFALALAVAGTALGVVKCEGPGPHPFTQAAHVTVASRPAGCTRIDGMCTVVEYILARPGRPSQIWTCFLTRLPAPEGHGVAFGAYTCEQPHRVAANRARR